MLEYHRDMQLPGYANGRGEQPLARAFELITNNRLNTASLEEGRLSNLNQATSSIEGVQNNSTNTASVDAGVGSVELYNAGE